MRKKDDKGMRRLLTTKDVVKILNKSQWSVENMFRSGKLPAQKKGNSYVVDANDFTMWIRKGWYGLTSNPSFQLQS